MPPSRTVVITGTDTEVGKTWVGCLLAADLSAAGLSVRTVKPLESGCAKGPPSALEDGVLLANASDQDAPTAALIRLEAPIAPPAAADREEVELDWDDIVDRTRDAIAEADIALVEGAGGLMSPLTWDRTAIDLAHALDAEVLVVAASRLGAINHVRLTLQAVERAGLTCCGVVVSSPVKSPLDTADWLRLLPEVPRLLEVPHGERAPGLGQWLLERP